MRKKLFIGTVDTLFENDNDSDSDLVERNEPEINFTQIDDQKLIDAYDSCLDQIQEPANININSEIKSTQNEDKMLIDAYDSCLHEIERADRKYDAKRELNDDCDDILNASYEKVKDSVEKSVNNRSMIPDNMIHLVRNSEKEIQRNHLLAKIRLIERSIKWSAKFKVEMSDYFIAIESWPNYAIEKTPRRSKELKPRLTTLSLLTNRSSNWKICSRRYPMIGIRTKLNTLKSLTNCWKNPRKMHVKRCLLN